MIFFKYVWSFFNIMHERVKLKSLNSLSAKVSIVDYVRISLREKFPYSGPYFPAFGLNKDHDNSEYGHFLFSDDSEKPISVKFWHVLRVTALKGSFPFRISLVNVTKFATFCGFAFTDEILNFRVQCVEW